MERDMFLGPVIAGKMQMAYGMSPVVKRSSWRKFVDTVILYNLDQVSQIAFPVSFSLFLTVYWIYYIMF